MRTIIMQQMRRKNTLFPSSYQQKCGLCEFHSTVQCTQWLLLFTMYSRLLAIRTGPTELSISLSFFKHIRKKNNECHIPSLIYHYVTLYVELFSICMCLQSMPTHTRIHKAHLKSHYFNAILSNNRLEITKKLIKQHSSDSQGG